MSASLWSRAAALTGLAFAVTAVAAGAAGAAERSSSAGSRPGSELCVIVRLLGLQCGEQPNPAPPTGQPAAPTPRPEPQPQPKPAAPDATEAAVLHSSTLPRYDPRRLSVVFKQDVTKRAADAVFARARVTVERAVPRLRAFMVDVDPTRRAAALASLRREPVVATAEREVLVDALDTVPNDSEWQLQWGPRVVGLPQAWDQSRGSSRVVVAVLDTGVDATHPDLRGALVAGYDFVNSDANPNDDHGHGTPVAGIIAARADNHEGIAGICWSCSIMPIKVIDAKGVGLDTSVAAGIVWAVDHGARVLNLSLGGAGTTQVLDDAVAYAVRRGALVVAAAGNEGSTVPFHPAASPGAVSIAATTAVDQRYRWSNFGSWVRLAAPGCNLAPVRGGRYAGFCGTSSATPLVSGLAALAFAVNPRATGAAVEDALERAAVPVAGVAQYGRVDAPATLSLAAASTTQARLTAVFRGTVGARPKRYVRAVGPGQVSVSLTFKGARSLSLALVTEDRVQPLLNVRRRSPIRVKRTLPGGTIALVVTGAAKHPARFALTVSYVPRPAAEFRSMRLAG